MAIRSDIIVDWQASPRIITVLAPSLAITIQDLHDSVTKIEEEPPNMSYERLIRSAGKDDLGGAASVGITATLQNAKLAFEARGGPSFVECNVDGGNLVAVDGAGGSISPIETTAYVQVNYAKSSSPTRIGGGGAEAQTVEEWTYLPA